MSRKCIRWDESLEKFWLCSPFRLLGRAQAIDKVQTQIPLEVYLCVV
ncbi:MULTISPECIES: hypothetical protein [Limnospira]|uniref:Uncharacterized protein n=1 Tax=Limnospira fusiformis PMC 851.14 TaxID=2219512 RepID=A0ABU9EHX3_LIMFS|nr:hypothetical protein [Limnospira sp. PMC 737.11]